MDLNLLTVGVVVTFLLILTRLGGMLASSPLFSGQGIPMQIKIAIAMGLAITLFPLHAGAKGYQPPTDLIQLALLLAQEFAIGVCIGLAADLIFVAIRMAGEFMGFQMGLTISNLLDPQSGTVMPMMGQLLYLFAFMAFLSLNIHHGLIVAVDRSFAWLPLGQGGLLMQRLDLLFERFVHLGGEMFGLAVALALPVIGILFIAEIALAFVAKVMPQMNIFMVALPLKVAMGLLLIALSAPFFSEYLAGQYAQMIQHLLGLYQRVA